MIPVPMRMRNAQLRKSARVASRIESIAGRRPCGDPAGQRIRRGVREEPREHEGYDCADGKVDHHRRRFPDSQSASATSATASTIRTITTRSKTRTAAWALSNRSAGISGIVPKSSGSVTPSRFSRIPLTTPGGSAVAGSGS